VKRVWRQSQIDRELVEQIEQIGTTDKEIIQAEYIERFTEHDIATASDYIKLCLAKKYPQLKSIIESVHFAATSEDVMSNVFDLVGNELVYRYFFRSLLDFFVSSLNYGILIKK